MNRQKYIITIYIVSFLIIIILMYIVKEINHNETKEMNLIL